MTLSFSMKALKCRVGGISKLAQTPVAETKAAACSTNTGGGSCSSNIVSTLAAVAVTVALMSSRWKKENSWDLFIGVPKRVLKKEGVILTPMMWNGEKRCRKCRVNGSPGRKMLQMEVGWFSWEEDVADGSWIVQMGESCCKWQLDGLDTNGGLADGGWMVQIEGG